MVHAAQHLHGGIGVDRDYPLHRYFLLAKQLELSLGGATRQLVNLGRLARRPRRHPLIPAIPCAEVVAQQPELRQESGPPICG